MLTFSWVLFDIRADRSQFMPSQTESVAVAESLTTDATVLGDFTPLERIVISSSGNLQRVIRYCIGSICCVTDAALITINLCLFMLHDLSKLKMASFCDKLKCL